MITLITGGSKCGKSAFAESLLDRHFTGGKYYIATMQPFGAEAQAAIQRHRTLRKGKGFATIEAYRNLQEVCLPGHCGVLLECIGNLCANEMFACEEIQNPTDTIICGIQTLSAYAEHLVIVTNEVGCDGIAYTAETQLYIRAMAEINRNISAIAENVIECVYGIPVILKGGIPC